MARRWYQIQATREGLETPQTVAWLPSVTTVLGDMLAKPLLVNWAERQGREGNSVSDILSSSAARGTAVHAALEDWAKFGAEIPVVGGEAAPYMRGLAKWVHEQHPRVARVSDELQAERLVVHTQLGYAGQVDLVIEREGQLWLVDAKTSSGVYESHHIQLSAYKMAWENMGSTPAAGAIVLHFTKGGNYKEHAVEDLSEAWTHQVKAWWALHRANKLPIHPRSSG